MRAILVLMVWASALSIVGCNDAEMKAEHPVATEVIETAAKDLGDVLEPIVDTELHLPTGSAKIIVTDLEHEIEK